MNSISGVKGKNILFLQGPMGDFFKQLDTLFTRNGATTYKIGFNAGDSFFSNHTNYIPYKETPQEYKAFIENFLQAYKIDMIFLFGDCRFYQSISIQVAQKLKRDVYVFEEGYIRPNYITMEKFGVNNFSKIPRDAQFYKALPYTEEKAPLETHYSPVKMVMSAITYYLISNIFSFRYPHYIHHRDFSAIKEAFFGVRSFIRKYIYKFTEKGMQEHIVKTVSKQYFFIPLQTYNDFQILQHSHYHSIESFIEEVLESFAQHGDKKHTLIFKHHPVDRGRKDYTRFIMHKAQQLGIEKNIIVLHDTHLPTLLKNAIGTITVNSTVGLSSLYHATPTITLGNAIYDIEGLTCKGMKLSTFWKEQCDVDMVLLHKYRTYLIEQTQLNGSFYGKLPSFKFTSS